MTTAIDISYWQHSPDFAKVRAAGVSLVIMKMGGAEPGHLYFDSVYKANRVAARAVGLAVGSYFFNGAVNPTDAANFQMNNVDWQPGDVVALDVENATNVARWNPAQVLEWCRTILARGVPASRILVYMSSSVTRAANWSSVAALGVGLWVAQYGTNNGSPQGSPSIAYWSSWALWQYTSTKTWPGIVGNVDTNLVADSWVASSGGTPIVEPVSQEIGDVTMRVIQRNVTGETFSIAAGYLKHHATTGQRDAALAAAGQAAAVGFDDTGFLNMVWNAGLSEFTPDGSLFKLLTGHAPGQMWSASWLYGAAAASVTLSDAQLATIAAAVKVPVTDVSAILDAVKALPTADQNGAAARAAIVK